MKILLGVLAASAVLMTALPFVRVDAWWIRIFDFPRLQIAALCLVGLVLYALVARWSSAFDLTLLGALALCVAYQLACVVPYTPLATPQTQRSGAPPPGQTLRLMVANVLMSNREAEALLRIVREAEPDVLLAVETDAWWQAQLDALVPEYPHQVRHPLDNTYGMLLYSRLPLQEAAVRFLVEDEVPSIFARLRLPAGTVVDFVGVHPRPPRPDKRQDTTQRDAELVLVGREVATYEEPVVVAGDLNDVAWSRTTQLFQRLSGLLDPRVGRGLFSTFHAKYPLWRYPLDHIFHSEHFRLVRMERLPRFGSDHFPILAELAYEPEARRVQEAPEADREDRREAEEEVEKAEEKLDGVEQRVPLDQ